MNQDAYKVNMTNFFRFVRFDPTTNKADFNREIAAELYDYTNNNEEEENLADDPNYSSTVVVRFL